jgi:1-acyl-sn-glycerol-3-phosphate acyltransferase
MALTLGDIGANLARLASVGRKDVPDDPLAQRDPDFIRRQRDWLGALCETFYQPDIQGLDHLPTGRALVVGTHNGGYMAPDMFSLMVASWHRFDPAERAAYGLAHDLVMRAPGAGRWLAKLGAVPASPKNAERLLGRDVAVLVYPGGDRDAFKPYRDRHLVHFAGRKGFIRMALRSRAPIVPVVSVGAHEVFRVLTDGVELARRSGLKKYLRMDVLPIALAFPTGLAVGAFAPYLPVPTKIRVRLLPPIDLQHPPEAADDPAIVDGLYLQVVEIMQSALDALVRAGDFGVMARFLG